MKTIGIFCGIIIFLILVVTIGTIFLVNDEDGFIGSNELGEEYSQTENLEKNYIK